MSAASSGPSSAASSGPSSAASSGPSSASSSGPSSASSSGPKPSEPARTLATFYVGEWLFGLPASQVREVMRQAWVTSVPLLPPAVRGVFNARGELVTVLDLRCRLGLPAPEPHAPAADVHVILETPDGTVSLLVDRAGDVRSVGSSAFESPPAHLSEGARECVLGAYTFEQGIVLLLDAARTLLLPEDTPAEAAAQRAQGSA